MPSKSFAQKLSELKLTGIYGQWGYNRDWFTRSSIRFNGNHYDFTLHKVKAHDKPDFSGFVDNPWDITIPQNSFRIGFYLNEKRTRAIELNFDHAKYVMANNQRVHMTGHIGDKKFNQDTLLIESFVKFEHTNGANFYHINYVAQRPLWNNKKNLKATWLYKIGAGVCVPRSDVTLFGKSLDNKYHIAGFVVSAESGFRFYPLKNFFLELNGKLGYANFADVLTVSEGKAHHQFGYAEVIGLIGYDLIFKNKKTKATL